MTGAGDQIVESSHSDWSTKFCKLLWQVANKHISKISQEHKTGQRLLQVTTSTRSRKLELCFDVKRKEVAVQIPVCC